MERPSGALFCFAGAGRVSPDAAWRRNVNGKLKPPHHWERQIVKYERKMAAAKNPTQRGYAQQMKRAAEKSLEASKNGVEVIAPDGAIELDPADYREV